MPMNEQAPASDITPKLYELALAEKWHQVKERAESHTDEAFYWHPTHRTTALHLAAKGSRGALDRIEAIRSLLEANSEAACLQAETSECTPLHYACMIPNDKQSTMDEHRQIVKLILQYNPESIHVKTKDGRSPLDVNIMYVSKAKKKVSAIIIPGITSSRRFKGKSQRSKSSCTSILRVLLEARSVMNVSKPLDLLLECNSLELLENVALEEAQASSLKLRARRMARSDDATVVTRASTVCTTGSTNFAHYWVWEWAILILKSRHKRKFSNYKPTPIFSIMHEAAQVKDCPVPFLMLAMRAFPEELRSPEPLSGNYPLHFVAGWNVKASASVSRKSMALSAVVSEFPEATVFRNKQGMTPLSLALSTGTSWENGVRRLATFQNEENERLRAENDDDSIAPFVGRTNETEGYTVPVGKGVR